MKKKMKIAISTCLLGESVRYDGGHKRDDEILKTFGNSVEWIGICPETECGLPVPRESMRIDGRPDCLLLIGNETGKDYTPQLKKWIKMRLRNLEAEGIHGYIFKSRSPSCGLNTVEIYNKGRLLHDKGRGFWAETFTELFPEIPVIEEQNFHQIELQKNFLQALSDFF